MKLANIAILVSVFLAGCNDARVASRNLSIAAENFEIDRRIVFYNGITDTYMLTIEGRCDILDDRAGQLEVTCKTSDQDYTKHFLGLSDNVTYFAEQLEKVIRRMLDPRHRSAIGRIDEALRALGKELVIETRAA